MWKRFCSNKKTIPIDVNFLFWQMFSLIIRPVLNTFFLKVHRKKSKLGWVQNRKEPVPLFTGGGGAASKVKVKSFGYQRTESSIHGSMAHGNVKKVNGQLVNDFTPTLEQAMAEKPGQTNNPLLVKQFQNGVKLPVR